MLLFAETATPEQLMLASTNALGTLTSLTALVLVSQLILIAIGALLYFKLNKISDDIAKSAGLPKV